MENTTKELKKLGNKVYSISVKIQECSDKGMTTRIPSYVQELEKTNKEIELKIKQLKSVI